jgi:peptidoglycan/LPS O-acetylase OafA/YrhL
LVRFARFVPQARRTRMRSLNEPLTDQNAAPARLRLGFLDGLRGLAALYVLNHHILHDVGWRHYSVGDWPRPIAAVINLMTYGHFAVGLFIVLSGFCLMLPVLRSPGHDVPGGFAGFFARRARRILPAYYATLAFSLALIWLVPATKYGGYANFDPGVILSHVLVVHHLRDEWVYGINGPLWSVGTEWHIYFAFFAVLLPVWRRWGSAIAVGIGFTLGIGVFMLFSTELYRACPWFLGLFALGMAAASIATSQDPGACRWRERRWPWIAAMVVPTLIVWLILTFRPQWTWYDGESELIGEAVVPMDMLWGAAVASFLVFAGSRIVAGAAARSRVVRLLECKPVVWLGACSYSVYLVHMPLVKLVWAGLKGQGLSRTMNYGVMLVTAVPLTLAVAYLFYRLFEKPFMGRGVVHAPTPERDPQEIAVVALAK